MGLLIIIFSLFLFLQLFLIYRLSGGLLAVPFLIFIYIVLLYLGTLHFYFSEGHLSFVFVFFMALFYLAGICLAHLKFNFGRSSISTEQLMIFTPLHRAVLKFSLITVFLIALGIAIYRIFEFGIPLFKRNWYTTGIQSSTGVLNKLLFNTGVESLIVMSLISYGLYKSEKDGRFRSLAAVFFISYLVFQTLNGGKSTAIMPFVLFGMAIFYCDRKIPRKLLIMAGLCVLVLVLFIGAFWAVSFSPSDILPIFYERVTSIAAIHLDYVLYGWAPNHSFEFGNTIWLELKRFIAQVTSVPKEPLFNEFIGNLRVGASLSRVTGVSPELSLFGMAYANLGLLGAILSALVFGYFVQWINLYLLSRRSMNLFSFTLLVYFMFKLLAYVRGGNTFITLQTFFIAVVPAFTIIAIVYFCLALPFPHALRWRKNRLALSTRRVNS